jgi:electron transport complex protein RnfA
MENNALIFFTMTLTALAMENALFFRVLGLNKYVLFLNSPKMGMLYGGVFTGVLMLSSLLVSAVNSLVRDNPFLTTYVRVPAYFFCVVAVYIAVYMLTRRFLPKLFERIRDILPLSTFNTALFGVFYTSAMNGFVITQTMGYALGAGAGYTLAVMILYFARKRLAMSPVPRSFRGLPLLLVYIGLLALALYGLIGHGLPT